jgi:mono/diheme cytochrome c family protein
MRHRPALRLCWLGCLLISLWVGAACAGTMTPDELAAQGEQLYRTGRASGNAELSARIGAAGSWVVRGAVVACSNCHGVHGQGSAEGASRAPSLRWSLWRGGAGDQRAARERLAEAVRHGRDERGRSLDPTMPRFDLDDTDLAALAAHLQSITSKPAEAPQELRLAALLPDDAIALPIERELATRLAGCFGAVGGRVRLEVIRTADAEAVRLQLRRLQKDASVLALLAPALRQIDDLYLDDVDLPLLFPLHPDPDALVNSGVNHRWLFGGSVQASLALIEYWQRTQSGQPLYVYSSTPNGVLERRLQQVLAARRPALHLHWRVAPQASDKEKPGGHLWLRDESPPTQSGLWLLPRLPIDRTVPAVGVTWWIALPALDSGRRSGVGLAQLWAEATCRAATAAVQRLGAAPTRDDWRTAVGNVGRLTVAQSLELDLSRSPAVRASAIAEIDRRGFRLLEPEVRIDWSP